jgi:pectinesterase
MNKRLAILLATFFLGIQPYVKANHYDIVVAHDGRGNYFTASSAPEDSRFGFVFLNCILSSEPGVLAYLGRPWREYANVAFIKCKMGAHIRPEGWYNWGKPEREKTVTYVEYHSKGPGANIIARVKWSRQLTDQEAKKYTIQNILSGADHWDYKKPN